MNISNHSILTFVTGTALLATLGCASNSPQLDAQIVKTQTSIDMAEESGARQYSSAALERARTSLKNAQAAAERKDYDVAQRLAHEAELDAELAAAQADHQKVEQALAEINESIETLRREISRNTASGGGIS